VRSGGAEPEGTVWQWKSGAASLPIFLPRACCRQRLERDLLRRTRDIQSDLTGWRCDNGCEGRMEEWKAPWLTTESGFADIVIGIGVIKSGNVYESDV
jgi:hypothetical protein